MSGGIAGGANNFLVILNFRAPGKKKGQNRQRCRPLFRPNNYSYFPQDGLPW